MSVKQVHRDVGPVLQIIRAFLRGRGWNEQNRWQEHISQRPYPKPVLPDGPSSKTSNNYYYTRDARRMSLPPIEIINANKQLTSGEKTSKDNDLTVTPKPGNTYNWD